MEAVDGNAIGGLLLEVFGTEMTDAPSVCASCGSVLMVFVTIHDRTCVDLMGLAALG
jgi:hypothetical protein